MNKPTLSYSSHNIYTSVSALKNERLPWNNLIILLDGYMLYEVGGERIELFAESVLFLPEGSPRVRIATDARANFFVFNFLSDTPINLPTVMYGATHGAVGALLSAYDAINASSRLESREENEHLLACLIVELKNKALTQSYSPLTRKILEYLRENFRERITLSDIGQVTFFSPVYCDAVFKEDVGTSIIDYVLTLRIEESKRLLVEGGVEMKEIAEMTGFGTGNYFSRVFKRRVGCSPTEYRDAESRK